MDLDVNSGIFTIHLQGQYSGKLWTGEFRAKKRLSHLDRLRQDALRRELVGPNAGSATVQANNIAIILSELRVRLIESPEWWRNAQDGALLEDEDVLLDVYNKALKVEDDATEQLKAEAKKLVQPLKDQAIGK